MEKRDQIQSIESIGDQKWKKTEKKNFSFPFYILVDDISYSMFTDMDKAKLKQILNLQQHLDPQTRTPWTNQKYHKKQFTWKEFKS